MSETHEIFVYDDVLQMTSDAKNLSFFAQHKTSKKRVMLSVDYQWLRFRYPQENKRVLSPAIQAVIKATFQKWAITALEHNAKFDFFDERGFILVDPNAVVLRV